MASRSLKGVRGGNTAGSIKGAGTTAKSTGNQASSVKNAVACQPKSKSPGKIKNAGT